MLENRLNILLAERRLKIKDVVTGTGLKRNTISNIVNNPKANISTNSLDLLMQFLKIEPGEFWTTESNLGTTANDQKHRESRAYIDKNGMVHGYKFAMNDVG